MSSKVLRPICYQKGGEADYNARSPETTDRRIRRHKTWDEVATMQASLPSLVAGIYCHQVCGK